MYFDRFDICEAYYLALSHCHGGQWSREYRRLCNLMMYFKPLPMLSVETLNDNAREIYENACNRFCSNKAFDSMLGNPLQALDNLTIRG